MFLLTLVLVLLILVQVVVLQQFSVLCFFLVILLLVVLKFRLHLGVLAWNLSALISPNPYPLGVEQMLGRPFLLVASVLVI